MPTYAARSPPNARAGKAKLDKGKDLAVPQPHGSPNVRGFACYFADTLARVLPLDDDAKSQRSRETFWQQIERAAAETEDPALRAVERFGQSLRTDAQLVAQIREDLAQQKPPPGARCTFAWYPDEGTTIVEREPVRNWYRHFFAAHQSQQQEAGPSGVCQVTGETGPMPTSHPTRIKLPGGMSSGVALVSNDKAAFESYRLDKAANASVGVRASEGYTRALNALIEEKLSAGRSCLAGWRCAFPLLDAWPAGYQWLVLPGTARPARGGPPHRIRTAGTRQTRTAERQ